jgi:hypothetical protein
MTSTRPLTASERYARFVLSAWNKQESTEFQAALTQVPFTLPGNLPAVEYERMDLIQDLGRDLLINGTDQNTALSLVRHLARCK